MSILTATTKIRRIPQYFNIGPDNDNIQAFFVSLKRSQKNGTMNTRITTCFVIAFFTLSGILSCTGTKEREDTYPRIIEDFDSGWKFSLAQSGTPTPIDFDDSSWRDIELPHDWAIEGDFSQDNPSGTGGGALPGGLGWYRKTFNVPASDSGKRISVEFDGAYMQTEVFINGQSLGMRPYGYISFGYDLTPYIRFGQENVIAVKVDNSDQPNSRWYSGCGIYRDVRLVKTACQHVVRDGTFVRADKLDGNGDAPVSAEISVRNDSDSPVDATLRCSILDDKGRQVTTMEGQVVLGSGTTSVASLEGSIPSAHLWSVSDPYLYTLETSVLVEGSVVDKYLTPFGVRTISFDLDGFRLNGKKVKLNGVCMHHDLGCLGAATSRRAIERQLEILRGMGCNAIRTSHNPPSPILLDLCDRMGFLVMDESFDMWRRRKTANDYARYFDKWYEQDLRDFVRRDRNHPSIVIWSIGNEVLEQWSSADADTLSLEEANLILNLGHASEEVPAGGEEALSVNSLLTIRLADIVREMDPSRPITAGCNETGKWNHLFRSGALDVIGFNYHNQDVLKVPQNYPGKPFVITESNSALATRGYYRMPSDSMYIFPTSFLAPFHDDSYSCSSYDNCHVPWGNTHEQTLKIIRDNDYVSGQFIWTGFDYIGEPTPYPWPARSSYFGVVDLAGFPKDAWWLYRSEWTDEPTLHLFPHWNWEEGQDIDMWCYYNNADEVELFVNGQSAGVKSKTEDCLHAQWRVKYLPGSVRVVSRKDGKEVAAQTIRTAGEPYMVKLTPDRSVISADGKDLSFVTVEILDKDGNLCPWAENDVQFDVKGTARIEGVDNGSPISMERFKDSHRKAFYGKCLVVLRGSSNKGKAVLTARSAGLQEDRVTIKTK